MNSRIHVEYTTLENIGQFIKYAVRNPDITIFHISPVIGGCSAKGQCSSTLSDQFTVNNQAI